MEKLKSSFRNLQGAITSMKPSISPTCIHQTKTQSFREEVVLVDLRHCCSSSSSSPSSSSSSSSSFHRHEKLPCLPEESVTSGAASPQPSSSPSTAERDRSKGRAAPAAISSERFFFSPCTTKSIMEEAKSTQFTCKGGAAAAFYEESTAVAVSSEDPYSDFRASMEEMVAAHRLWEWHGLQELLHCYLRLNDRRNHKVIVLAFVDLLMHLIDH